MQFTVTDNIPDCIRFMNEAEKRIIPLAHAKALTFTAEAVKLTEVGMMQNIFDRPTPYTLNALYLKPATLASQTAEVEFRGQPLPASHYLQPHVRGGTRRQKRSERSLALRGLMGNKGFWVPGKGAKLDKYGNITGGNWTKILSDLQVTSDPMQWRNTKKKKGRYFVPKQGSKLRAGIYERSANGKIKPIAIFVADVQYQKRFDFYGIANRKAEQVFPEKWAKSLERELARIRLPK